MLHNERPPQSDHLVRAYHQSKGACTSLKWWYADLEGCSQLLHVVATDNAESAQDLVIHDMLHKVAPNVAGLTPDMISEALTSDEYFRFAVVRNPYKRIFSAWQSKLLLQEPQQSGPYLQCDFFQHRIEGATDIATAFEGFLEHIAANEAPDFLDVHWTPQVSLLRPDLICCSKLVKIEEPKELLTALSERLGSHFVDPFANRHTNESLIPYLPMLMTERSAELIRQLYAEDFDTFGYSKNPPVTRETFSSDQFKISIKAIGLLRERHQRLGERNVLVNDLSRTVAERDQKITSYFFELDRVYRSTSWKITKPLRYLRRKLDKTHYFLRRSISGEVRRIWSILPLPSQGKQHLKQILFSRLPVIFSWSNSYQNWYELHFNSAMNNTNSMVKKPSESGYKILLISHEFSLTGAPRAVLYLAKAIFKHYKIRPEIISPVDGPIREEFERNGFSAIVAPWLLSNVSEKSKASQFLSGFDRVIVTSLSSYYIVRHIQSVVQRLTWWIHEDDAGFEQIRNHCAPDLTSLFDGCDAVWLGSPVCSLPVLKIVASDKVHSLLYGCEDVTLPSRCHESGRLVFTLVGTVEPRKGQDIFLSAIELLPEDLRTKALFRIIGSPLSKWTENFYKDVLARANQIPEVECLANMPFDHLLYYYAETDIMVSASRADPMPIVITQGLMFSKPCLCSSTIGHAHLLEDGKDGLLFASESTEALAEKMAWLLQNPAELSVLGAAGRKVYEQHFSMTCFIDNVSSLLNSKD